MNTLKAIVFGALICGSITTMASENRHALVATKHNGKQKFSVTEGEHVRIKLDDNSRLGGKILAITSDSVMIDDDVFAINQINRLNARPLIQEGAGILLTGSGIVGLAELARVLTMYGNPGLWVAYVGTRSLAGVGLGYFLASGQRSNKKKWDVKSVQLIA